MKLLELIKKMNGEESGQDLVEYALIIVAIGGATLGGSGTLAGDLAAVLNGVGPKFAAWGL